jgi:hypothetical protein
MLTASVMITSNPPVPNGLSSNPELLTIIERMTSGSTAMIKKKSAVGTNVIGWRRTFRTIFSKDFWWMNCDSCIGSASLNKPLGERVADRGKVDSQRLAQVRCREYFPGYFKDEKRSDDQHGGKEHDWARERAGADKVQEVDDEKKGEDTEKDDIDEQKKVERYFDHTLRFSAFLRLLP